LWRLILVLQQPLLLFCWQLQLLLLLMILL
jgi:hypothetical protein